MRGEINHRDALFFECFRHNTRAQKNISFGLKINGKLTFFWHNKDVYPCGDQGVAGGRRWEKYRKLFNISLMLTPKIINNRMPLSTQIRTIESGVML